MADGLFITNLWKNPYFFFSVGFIVLFSICCHEFMHAYIALKCGDSTAADRGHLTLNPLRQMGMWSLLLFAFFGIAWGAVPVNIKNLSTKGRRMMVAAAGPLTNLILALIFILITFLLMKSNFQDDEASRMIFYGGILNIVLCILNLLPLPGLDGFAIVKEIFPRILQNNAQEKITAIFFILMILLFAMFDKLFQFAFFMAKIMLNLLFEVFP